MSVEEVDRLCELVQGTDVEAVRGVLKTTFTKEILNKALDTATKQLELNYCLEERFQICSELLSVGAQVTFDPKCKSGRENYNLIQHCCCYGNSVLLKQAIATVDLSNTRSNVWLFSHKDFSTLNSPWILAVRATHTECVDVLFEDYIRQCVPLNTYPAIKYSAEAGNLACLNHLLKLYNYEYKWKFRNEPDTAILAFRNKHYECAKLLISCCSNIGGLLCETDVEEEWEFILTNMTNNPSRKAAAQYIATRYKWKCLKYVLQDSSVHAVFIKDGTILYNLIRESRFELIEQLLKYDVDINSPCSKKVSPLNFAIKKYHEDNTYENWKSVRTLISHGGDVDRCTPMSQWNFGVETLDMLLLAGANITPEYLDESIDEDEQLFVDTCASYSTVVHPLKHLARLSIRRALTIGRFGTVPKLSGVLPPTLVNYMMLPEIDEIETKYGLLELFAKYDDSDSYDYASDDDDGDDQD